MPKKLDIIIPAYKAHATIPRTLASVMMQTVAEDAQVIIVNDNPGDSYEGIVETFSPFISVRTVDMEENGGPGLARQRGMEEGNSPLVTFIDADDTFASAIALETMMGGIEAAKEIKCCSATFLQLGEDLQHTVSHSNDMVWMFGKTYRREWLEKYKIHFNSTRANEDTGFNTWVKLLCDNPQEQLRYIPETVYFWHHKPDSITRINDGQYAYDQCFCGWVDNMIWAIRHAKKSRPFSGMVTQQIAGVMLNLYFYWLETVARKPVFSDQNWEYIKKYYHACYKRIEEDMTDEAFSQLYSQASMAKWGSGEMMGVVPSIGIREFMDRLKTEPYDEDEIGRVWERMKADPETARLIENNEKCGVCPKGYANRPF